jgi:ABC-type Fe3+/spermidine/putrescine transport system ATPase subunit
MTIRAEHLNYAVGAFSLRDASLSIETGEYFVLLGPPGSGKSVFLECLCGLRTPNSGQVFQSGRDVTFIEPRERSIGYVPQDYALFPHLTVEENIGFGLKSRGWDRLRRRQRVEELTEMLGITPLLQRLPTGLSGGEKQRTALARALAPSPEVLLLDEPVSALDEATRERICGELRRLLKEYKISAVHVSHNLEEAFSVADRCGLMNEGQFQQIGTPAELLRQPRNEFVARFMRCENLFSGKVLGVEKKLNRMRVQVGATQLEVQGQADENEREVQIVIRPENVLLQPVGAEDDVGLGTRLPVRLTRIVDRGAYVRIETEGPFPLIIHLPHTEGLQYQEGAQATAVLRSEATHLLNGKNI